VYIRALILLLNIKALLLFSGPLRQSVVENARFLPCQKDGQVLLSS
jgi:hypothetical protein